MAQEGANKKFTRVRPLRVQASYDLQVGDVIELKELPFALDGNNEITRESPELLSKLKKRRFLDVTPENFESVLKGVWPHPKLKNKSSNNPS